MSTEIRFYHNAPDRLRVACVLCTKARAGGRKISVFAPDGSTSRHFDQMLWSFQPLSFVPHVAAGSPLETETPVVIGSLQAHQALLYLGLGNTALAGRLWLWDGLDLQARSIRLQPDPHCVVCGAAPQP